MTPPDPKPLSQWTPWQLTDFSAPEHEPEPAVAALPETDVSADSSAAADISTTALPEGPVQTVAAALAAAEHTEALETERSQARQQGYDAGFAEGRIAGEQEGQKAGFEKGHAEGQAQAQAEVQRWQELTARLETALQDFDQHMAAAVLDLTLDIAQQVLRQSLHAHPELLLACVREALTQLPQAQAQISVHPEDAALVQKYLDKLPGHPGHRVQENSKIHPGGCLIETRDSQIDARLQTRWQRIAESLGRDTGWLEHDLPQEPATDGTLLEEALMDDEESPEDMLEENLSPPDSVPDSTAKPDEPMQPEIADDSPVVSASDAASLSAMDHSTSS